MRSHLGWTLLSVIGALALMATAQPAGAGTGQNLIVNGDFENGNTGFTTGYTLGNISGPGAYAIGNNPSTAPGAYGDWCNCGDHTTGTGKMMIVNGANSASLPVWEETVPVTASTTYSFSYWGASVDHESSSLPHMSLSINGQVIGSRYLPKASPDNGGHWQNYKFTWNSGSSQTADLALFDLNTDTPWNDFALDDVSFSAVSSRAGGAAAPAHNASNSGPITTHAKVTVKDTHGVEIPLKQEEKIAFMFMEAISSMEADCNHHLNRGCTLAELVAGPKSPDWPIGKLKYDPARDSNYKYTVTITGRSWEASANPQRAGLGGFFMVGNGFIPSSYYNANGRATASDKELGDTSAEGELFQVH